MLEENFVIYRRKIQLEEMKMFFAFQSEGKSLT